MSREALGSWTQASAERAEKEPISIKLPRYLIDWMDTQEESRPKLIEEALRRQYNIFPAGESYDRE